MNPNSKSVQVRHESFCFKSSLADANNPSFAWSPDLINSKDSVTRLKCPRSASLPVSRALRRRSWQCNDYTDSYKQMSALDKVRARIAYLNKRLEQRKFKRLLNNKTPRYKRRQQQKYNSSAPKLNYYNTRNKEYDDSTVPTLQVNQPAAAAAAEPVSGHVIALKERVHNSENKIKQGLLSLSVPSTPTGASDPTTVRAPVDENQLSSVANSEKEATKSVVPPDQISTTKILSLVDMIKHLNTTDDDDASHPKSDKGKVGSTAPLPLPPQPLFCSWDSTMTLQKNKKISNDGDSQCAATKVSNNKSVATATGRTQHLTGPSKKFRDGSSLGQSLVQQRAMPSSNYRKPNSHRSFLPTILLDDDKTMRDFINNSRLLPSLLLEMNIM